MMVGDLGSGRVGWLLHGRDCEELLGSSSMYSMVDDTTGKNSDDLKVGRAASDGTI